MRTAFRLLLVMVVGAAAGCATISEKHLFATFVGPSPENPTGLVNIFRLRVDGNAGLANVRYIAGSYDERAVDFFFNEVKAETYTPSGGMGHGPDRVFRLSCPTKDDDGTEVDECKKAYEDALRVIPLTGDPDSADFDAFVIIMSTNANAIAETIGAFAENTLAIQSVNYLLNRETFEAEKTIATVQPLIDAERKAMLGSLDTSFAGFADNDKRSLSAELAILQAIAVALEPEGAMPITTIDEAKTWFSTVD